MSKSQENKYFFRYPGTGDAKRTKDYVNKIKEILLDIQDQQNYLDIYNEYHHLIERYEDRGITFNNINLENDLPYFINLYNTLLTRLEAIAVEGHQQQTESQTSVSNANNNIIIQAFYCLGVLFNSFLNFIVPNYSRVSIDQESTLQPYQQNTTQQDTTNTMEGVEDPNHGLTQLAGVSSMVSK